MIILDRTKNLDILEHCNRAVETAPNVWRHQRAMQWMRSLNAFDWDVGQAALRTAPPGSYRWIGIWPLSVAAAINFFHPEVFNDTTGEAMKRFLRTEAGAMYRAPGAEAHIG